MFNKILVYCSAQKHLAFELSRNIGIKTFHIVNNILNHLISSHHISNTVKLKYLNVRTEKINCVQ